MVALPFDTNKLIELCRENDVAKVSIFGSMARGEANEQSDIDLLVEFSKRKSLLALVALERKISSALGKKVDLLTEAAISPYLRDRIKRDLRVIYVHASRDLAAAGLEQPARADDLHRAQGDAGCWTAAPGRTCGRGGGRLEFVSMPGTGAGNQEVGARGP